MPSPAIGNPKVHRGRGLYDALDGSDAPEGSCFALVNLMRDSTTPRIWQPRPAVTEITDWTGSGFTNPGFVSVGITIGSYIFGMVATDDFPGKDRPFCYDTATQSFISISGVVSGDLPTSPATTGEWVPPTMSVTGVYIIICHPGYSGTGDNFFGSINITNILSPAYNDQNTTTNALPSVPLFSFSFFDRAYYAVKNKLWYSDVLDPLTITNATQFLVLGSDSQNLTGAGGLSISQTVGGIIAGYIIFKAEGGYWQLTGDAALTDQPLRLNGPVGNVGCAAPRTIQQTPIGLFFMATNGIRVINTAGVVSERPLHGVQFPFEQCIIPSRACALFNGSVYRICLETLPNPIFRQIDFYDYWFDFVINEWCGPHSFQYDQALALGDGSVLFSHENTEAIWSSFTFSQLSDVFDELGSPLVYLLQSSMFPISNMEVKAVIESTVDVSFAGGVGDVTAYFLDESFGVLAFATVFTPTGPSIWGSFLWGAAPWFGTSYGLKTFNLDWNVPVVYKKAGYQLIGNSFQGLRLGAFWWREQELGYLNIQNPP